MHVMLIECLDIFIPIYALILVNNNQFVQIKRLTVVDNAKFVLGITVSLSILCTQPFPKLYIHMLKLQRTLIIVSLHLHLFTIFLIVVHMLYILHDYYNF